jgi:hypothetical protein
MVAVMVSLSNHNHKSSITKSTNENRFIECFLGTKGGSEFFEPLFVFDK